MSSWVGQGLGSSSGSAPELLCGLMLLTPSLGLLITWTRWQLSPSQTPSTTLAQLDEDGPRTRASRPLSTLGLEVQSPDADAMVPFQNS